MEQYINKKQVFKEIMSMYPTGVTIITTFDGKGNPVGMTVNSFTSVSLEPLLVLWCIDKNASSLKTFRDSKIFAIHILSENQEDTCWTFAGKTADRFANISWETSANQLPIIKECTGYFECKTINEVDAGDHIILIGEVLNLKNEKKNPLIYFNRKVGAIPESLQTDSL